MRYLGTPTSGSKHPHGVFHRIRRGGVFVVWLEPPLVGHTVRGSSPTWCATSARRDPENCTTIGEVGGTPLDGDTVQQRCGTVIG